MTSGGGEVRGDQRYGRVVRRHPTGGGATGRAGVYVVRDDDGVEYSYDYTNIVTEGFRTAIPGERVRFFSYPDRPGKAEFVIRLDVPDVGEYYG